MKKAPILFLFVISILQVNAQYYANQNKIWAFGHHAGVSFSSGAPVAISTNINTNEGTANVCDVSGNILFYTDGKNVWDSTNTLMPSGAGIIPYPTYSSSQAALIVPVMNNPGQYYIFSTENEDDYVLGDMAASRIYYTIVDMSLHGGLGDVTAPGTLLTSIPGTEKVIAIPGNNCNIWVLTHGRDTALFYAYNVTTSGISLTPVISAVGSMHGYRSYNTGVMKCSPSRLKLAVQSYYPSDVGTELYDFNPATGVVSNCMRISSGLYEFGAEFSPDNTKLYTQNLVPGFSVSNVSQYDVTLPAAPAITASRVILATGPYDHITDLKTGPDGKIYLVSVSSSSLDCIAHPNLPGTSCGYTTGAVNLFPNYGIAGLPNLYWAATPPVTGHTILCIGTTATLSDGITGGTWLSGNTAVATIGSTSGIVTGVSIGTAVITYTTPTSCTTTMTVTVVASPGPITGITHVCVGSTTTLSDPGGGTWLSSNTAIATVDSGTSMIRGVSPGIVTITYSLGAGCSVSTMVTVQPVPLPITGTTVICYGDSTLLSNATPGGTWSTSDTLYAVINPATGMLAGIWPGFAVVSYTLSTGCSAAIGVTVNPLPDAGVILGTPGMCAGTTATMADVITGGTWRCTNTHATITGGGVVTAVSLGIDTICYIVSNSCGTDTAFFEITIDTSPYAGVLFPEFAGVCVDSMLTYTDTIGAGVWICTNGHGMIIGPGVIMGISPGVDTVYYIVTNSCGSDTARAYFIVNPNPAVGPITGPSMVCVDSVIALSDSSAGGYWSCTNSHATVSSSGIVTGVSKGTDTVIYTIVTTCGRVADSQAIVINAVLPAGIIRGIDSVCMGSEITLSDTTSGGLWSSSNGKASVSSGGIVTGLAAGLDTIVYSVTNICGISTAIFPVRIVSHTGCNANVKPIYTSSSAELKIYPNPNSGIFSFDLLSGDNTEVRVTVTNIVGEKIKEFTTISNNIVNIDMGKHTGLYFINASTSQGRYIMKVLIEH